MGPTQGQLKGAVVGAGYFSQFHLDAWQQISEVQLVALCDLDDLGDAADDVRVDAVRLALERHAQDAVADVPGLEAGRDYWAIRLDDDRFLVTPSGLYKRRLKSKQLVIVDHQGEVIKGRGDLKPSSELLMHLED